MWSPRGSSRPARPICCASSAARWRRASTSGARWRPASAPPSRRLDLHGPARAGHVLAAVAGDHADAVAADRLGALDLERVAGAGRAQLADGLAGHERPAAAGVAALEHGPAL